MIASLRGSLLEKTEDGAVVEVSGLGYQVTLSPSALAGLPPMGEEVTLFVAESVAMYGGGVTLYGFRSAKERRLFNLLRDNVPGTGAKKALEFLDKAGKSLPGFRRAVAEKDARTLMSIFGFTAKTAEKMIAGLSGHLAEISMEAHGDGDRLSALDEAIQGLVSLGYKEFQARQAAETARRALGEATSQDLIRESLRRLSGRTGA